MQNQNKTKTKYQKENRTHNLNIKTVLYIHNQYKMKEKRRKGEEEKVERSYQVGYRLYPNYEAYGASAAPSQITSSYSAQNQPTLVVAYQTIGQSPRRNANSKK